MAKKKSEKELKNVFTIRLYDVETVKSIEELMNMGEFENYNDLLSRAVVFGIEKMYLERGKRRLLGLSHADREPAVPPQKVLDELLHKVERMRLVEEDNYIILSMVKVLTASVYNALKATISNEPLTGDLMENVRYMSMLPDQFREIEDKLLTQFKRREEKALQNK